MLTYYSLIIISQFLFSEFLENNIISSVHGVQAEHYKRKLFMRISFFRFCTRRHFLFSVFVHVDIFFQNQRKKTSKIKRFFFQNQIQNQYDFQFERNTRRNQFLLKESIPSENQLELINQLEGIERTSISFLYVFSSIVYQLFFNFFLHFCLCIELICIM